MGFKMSKVRDFIAMVVALVILVVFAAFVVSAMGLNIPGLRQVGDLLGFGG